jgi:hypothetical protein
VPDELGVDAAFTYAPGDQLGVLAAEIEDEDRALFEVGLGNRRLDADLSWGGNSATPS